jgi:hypothetical protein
VIAFYGGEPRIPSNQDIDRALRAAFPENEEHLQFSSQYLDSGRFEGPENERLLVNFLRGRYAGVKVDLLFATDPVALRLLVRYRAEIFPRVPIVFADIRKATLATMDLPRDVVGVGVDVGAEPIIELALRLRPATRELVIVTGTSELDRTWEARFRAAAAKLAPSLPARVLSSLPIEGIERELAMLKPSSVVLMGAFRRDGAGRPLAGTLAALDRLRVGRKGRGGHLGGLQ